MNVFRFAPNCFAPNVGKVRTKDGVSIGDVVGRDGAVLKQVVTYQTLEFPFRRCANHGHEAASKSGPLHLFFGETFVIRSDSVDGGGRGKPRVCD